MSLDTPHKDIEAEINSIFLDFLQYLPYSEESSIEVEVKQKAIDQIMNLITTHTERAVVAEIDKKVIEVLGMYAEDVFTPTTKEDKDVFNEVNPNAHTRIHCGGIRHGLHQLRRAARDLSPRDDLEVIHVPPLQKGTNHV